MAKIILFNFRNSRKINCRENVLEDRFSGQNPTENGQMKFHWNSLKFHWKSVRWKIVVIFGEISLIFQWNSVTKIRSLKFQWNATEFHWNINELTETSMDFTEFHWHIIPHWNVTEILIAQWNIQLETCIHFFS